VEKSKGKITLIGIKKPCAHLNTNVNIGINLNDCNHINTNNNGLLLNDEKQQMTLQLCEDIIIVRGG
jgi:hypothetical protein